MARFSDNALHVVGWWVGTLGALLRVCSKVGAVLTVVWWIFQLAIADGVSFTTIIPVALLMACGVAYLIGSAFKNVGVALIIDYGPEQDRR